jgi:alanine racemase
MLCSEPQALLTRVPRPIQAVVDLAAMRHNLARARARAGRRFVWAVVKANAYGHGLARAVRAFTDADGLALLDLDEAQRTRDAGWRKPILLLEGCFEAADVDVCAELRLTPVVHCADQIALLEAARLPAPLAVYLKLNTGMNRLGFGAAAARAAYERLKALPQVSGLTLMMHFANADRPEGVTGPVATSEQIAEFERICAAWPEPRSLCNSAALFLLPEAAGDAVRPGIVLYGAATDESHAASSFGLRPAMTLRARIIAVQTLNAGQAVGYGARYVSEGSTRVGVVACGYADGYPRHAPDGTPVVVDGVRVPLVGRVSMDMITVDLSRARAAGVGSDAELWGATLPVDEVANAAGTVGYELLCALAQRVPVIEAG